jgi:hypothetical protein
MARDGQGARDYGTHLVPQAEWRLYDACPKCGSDRGQPCQDKRFKGWAVPKYNWTAHPNRPLIPAVSGAEVMAMMNRYERRGWRPSDILKREALRALNSVALPNTFMSGRHRWRLVAPVMHAGFKITAPAVHKPWSRSTHQASYLSHITTGVLFVWRDGVLILTQVRWRCGARSQTYRLMDEPDSQICPACKIERIPRERQ